MPHVTPGQHRHPDEQREPDHTVASTASATAPERNSPISASACGFARRELGGVDIFRPRHTAHARRRRAPRRPAADSSSAGRSGRRASRCRPTAAVARGWRRRGFSLSRSTREFSLSRIAFVERSCSAWPTIFGQSSPARFAALSSTSRETFVGREELLVVLEAPADPHSHDLPVARGADRGVEPCRWSAALSQSDSAVRPGMGLKRRPISALQPELSVQQQTALRREPQRASASGASFYRSQSSRCPFPPRARASSPTRVGVGERASAGARSPRSWRSRPWPAS